MPQFITTATVAAGPTQLSSTVKNFRTATMIACKSINGPTAGPNASKVRIGLSGTAANQPIEFNPGDERVFYAAPGQMLDLSQYYLVVTTDGDGLVVIYQ